MEGPLTPLVPISPEEANRLRWLSRGQTFVTGVVAAGLFTAGTALFRELTVNNCELDSTAATIQYLGSATLGFIAGAFADNPFSVLKSRVWRALAAFSASSVPTVACLASLGGLCSLLLRCEDQSTINALYWVGQGVGIGFSGLFTCPLYCGGVIGDGIPFAVKPPSAPRYEGL